MDWLPELGNPSHGGQSSVPAPPDTEVDEVQYSIVCDDCGRHFWSRSKADPHAALTAHVLHEANVSPSSHFTVPHSPAINSACAPEGNMHFASAIEAEASPNSKNPDLEDRGDSGDEEYSPCFDCGKYFWSHEAVTDHAKTGHLQDTEMVPSTTPDGSPTSSAANLGISRSSPHWTGPVTGPALAHQFLKHPFPSRASNSGDGNTRSPAPSPDSGRDSYVAATPSAQDVPSFMNNGIQTIFTPTTAAPPSPSSSCQTLKHPLVEFSPELFDRIFFIVGPSGNRKAPSFIMGLPEAQNAVTFRAGVCARLESQGEQVGSREIIARPSWLPVPVYADTNEDHHLLLLVIKGWPEWQKTNRNTSCHVFVTLEDEKENKEGEEQQEIPSTADN